MLVPAERCHRAGGIIDVLQPDACEDERCGPPFRTFDQQIDLLVAELDLAVTHEQRVRLLRGEGEVARAQLGELPRCPQPCKPDRGVDPCADDHAHVLGHVAEGVIDRRQAVPFGYGVEVIEHEDHRRAVAAECAQQLVDRMLDRGSWDIESTQRRSAEARANPIDRRRDVSPHPAGVVVAGVERNPRQRGILGRTPHPDGRRLPVAHGRRHERQRGVGVEHGQDARASDVAAAHTWCRELRLDEWRRVPRRRRARSAASVSLGLDHRTANLVNNPAIPPP